VHGADPGRQLGLDRRPDASYQSGGSAAWWSAKSWARLLFSVVKPAAASFASQSASAIDPGASCWSTQATSRASSSAPSAAKRLDVSGSRAESRPGVDPDGERRRDRRRLGRARPAPGRRMASAPA